MDKKLNIGIIITILLASTGAVASFYSKQEDTKEEGRRYIEQVQREVTAAIDTIKKDNADRFATKEELSFLVQSMARVERGVDIANENIFKIQQNQIPLRVVAERVARIQKSVSATNAGVSNVNEKVDNLKPLVEKALPKKKKGGQ